MQIRAANVTGAEGDSVTYQGDSYSVKMHTDVDSWERCESELREAGVHLPATWRSSWLRRHDGTHWFITVADPRDGKCAAGMVLQVTKTRALPGHFVVRSERVGATRSTEARDALIAELARWATSHPRVLRLEVATFSRDPGELEAMRRALAAVGFQRSADSRMYTSTLILDLVGAEDDILQSLHKAARQKIRAATRNANLETRLITDEQHIPAMSRLVDETRQRTGGASGQRPWAAHLRVAREQPELVRFVGLFRKDSGQLLAFASSHHHGDYAVYADGASTRASDLRVPMAYVPMWELIRWAKHNGARWFDLGGVTEGTFARGREEDPLGGISDFKRFFSRTTAHVSDEWLLEPHRARALVANVLSVSARWMRDERTKLQKWGRGGLSPS